MALPATRESLVGRHQDGCGSALVHDLPRSRPVGGEGGGLGDPRLGREGTQKSRPLRMCAGLATPPGSGLYRQSRKAPPLLQHARPQLAANLAALLSCGVPATARPALRDSRSATRERPRPECRPSSGSRTAKPRLRLDSPYRELVDEKDAATAPRLRDFAWPRMVIPDDAAALSLARCLAKLADHALDVLELTTAALRSSLAFEVDLDLIGDDNDGDPTPETSRCGSDLPCLRKPVLSQTPESPSSKPFAPAATISNGRSKIGTSSTLTWGQCRRVSAIPARLNKRRRGNASNELGTWHTADTPTSGEDGARSADRVLRQHSRNSPAKLPA